MADYRGVSPFTNRLQLDFFVGRQTELKAVRSEFLRGVRGIIIVGSAGSGKTSLALTFARRFGEEFPGGVGGASASWAESPDQLLRRVLHGQSATEARLVVLDDAEALDEDAVHQLQHALRQDPHLRLLLTSRRSLPLEEDFERVELGGLSREEFDEFLRLRNALAHDELTAEVADELFRVAGGSALMADLAVTAVKEGVVGSWRDLFAHLQTFHSPGILGPDGFAIDAKSAAYRKVIIDVSSANEELLRLLKRELDLAWKLPPKRFEEIVAEILDKQGYLVDLTPASGDGGLDIYAARQDGLGKFLYLVECKRYVPPNKVGVEVVRSLYGVIQTQKATAGAIVSTSFFTAGAQEFQRRVQHQMHLHDYLVLQKWIEDFPLIRDEPT